MIHGLFLLSGAVDSLRQQRPCLRRGSGSLPVTLQSVGFPPIAQLDRFGLPRHIKQESVVPIHTPVRQPVIAMIITAVARQ